MCDPVENVPLVSKPPCNPTYASENRLPNGEKICVPKLVQSHSGPIAGGIPPSPALIFEEDDEVNRDQTKFTIGIAEYSCKTRLPQTEHETVTRDVSVVRIPNESENITRARLEQAARDLAKTITGCHDVKFERLQPIVNRRTKAVIPHSKPTTVVANKCEGEWATRSVCRK